MNSAQTGNFKAQVRRQINDLPPTMRRVAQYMEHNRLDVVALSAAEIGDRLGTSDATVIRTAKALGYSGLTELKRVLTRELSAGTPVDNFQRTVKDANADARHAAKRSLDITGEIIVTLREPKALDALDRMLDVLDRADRIVLFGIGPTAHLLAYAALQLRRHGRKTLILDRTGRELSDALLDLRDGDAILIVSYRQPIGEAMAVLEDVRALGLPLLLITNRTDHPLARSAQETIVVPRGGGLGMALNGATFVYLEALLVGLSVRAPETTRNSLRRLEELRSRLDRLS